MLVPSALYSCTVDNLNWSDFTQRKLSCYSSPPLVFESFIVIWCMHIELHPSKLSGFFVMYFTALLCYLLFTWLKLPVWHFPESQGHYLFWFSDCVLDWKSHYSLGDGTWVCSRFLECYIHVIFFPLWFLLSVCLSICVSVMWPLWYSQRCIMVRVSELVNNWICDCCPQISYLSCFSRGVCHNCA